MNSQLRSGTNKSSAEQIYKLTKNVSNSAVNDKLQS